MSIPPPTSPANAQKNRKGLNRVWHAAGYSIEGLKAGWHETAFRQEALAALVLVPLAFWLGMVLTGFRFLQVLYALATGRADSFKLADEAAEAMGLKAEEQQP